MSVAPCHDRLRDWIVRPAHRIAGSHVAEIADYEAVHAHILKMADMLSAGIMQQFPSRFNGAA